jgi:hypothetical protein
MTGTVSVAAVREYGIVMPNGVVGKLTFAMCDPRENDTLPARFARQQGAKVYGLISIEGIARAPRNPIIWIMIEHQIAVTVGDGEPDLSADLREVIQKHMQEYLRDMADLAPGLCSVELKPRTLH